MSKPLVAEPAKDNFSFEDGKHYTPKQYRVVTKEDGTKEYICEWDLVMTRHMVQHLSREEFLKEV